MQPSVKHPRVQSPKSCPEALRPHPGVVGDFCNIQRQDECKEDEHDIENWEDEGGPVR